MAKLKDISGQRFGRLVVISRTKNTRDNHTRWLCKCDCGKMLVVGGTVLRRKQQSCGCIRWEKFAQQVGAGHPMYGKKHTIEARTKIAASGVGRKSYLRDDKWRAAARARQLGKKPSLSAIEKQRKKISGANNHWWRGGVSLKNWGIRQAVQSIFEYQQWRSAVFHRDDFTCQDCGNKSGGNLQVHHKKPFQKIIDEYGITIIEDARRCAELWDIFNGITLCVECHKKQHQ